MTFAIEKAPHIATNRTTRKIMLELSAVLLCLFVYSTVWYFVKAGTEYGVHAIIIWLVSDLTCVFADALWALPHLWDKKIANVGERFKNWGLQILDSYGYVTALVFALLMPVGVSYYIVFVGAFVGTFLAKSLFGGFGKNIFNPAVVGRVFVQICFSTQLKTYLGTTKPDTVLAGASITTVASNLGWTTNLTGISLADMFLGNYRGTLGEPFAFLIIIIAIYLIVRKIIDWRTPVFYLGTLFLTTLVMGFSAGLKGHAFEFALRQLMLGGALFGSIICLTDPVTGPTSRAGKCIIAVIAAVITALIRYKASSVEGVAYSILLANMLSPLVSRFLMDKSDKHLPAKAGTLAGLVVLSMVFGLVHGLNNKTSDTYSKGVQRYDSDRNFYSLVINTASTSAGSYAQGTAPSLDAATVGTALKRIDFTIDSEPAAYYELQTASANMFKAGSMVDFGVIIQNTSTTVGAIGYKYISSDEDSRGQAFAQEIAFSKTTPYKDGDLTEAMVKTDLVQSGASSPVDSSKTIPAILTAIKAAEKDYGITFEEPIVTDVTGINALLTAQNLTNITTATTDTTPSWAAATVGTCTKRMSGFQVNGKDAVYYEFNTKTGFEDGDEYCYMTAICTSDGIVALSMAKIQFQEGRGLLKTFAAAVTVSKPYTATSTIAGYGVTMTGATHSQDAVEAALQGVLADFGG